MKSKLSLVLACMLFLSVLAVPGLAEDVEQDWRPRVIITTDGEYDDQCSMIRLIMYSDVLDIEALIMGSADPGGLWRSMAQPAGAFSRLSHTRRFVCHPILWQY